MNRILTLIFLLALINISFAQSISNDSVSKHLIRELNIIENSTNAIVNKIDSCCKGKPSLNKFRTTKINLEAIIDINNKIDLTIRKVDSSNISINSKIDSCRTRQVPQKELKSDKDINNCYCIYKIATILLILLLVLMSLCYYVFGKDTFLKLAKTNFEKALPHLPFVLIVWTIGFCLFLNVYCKIDFNDLASIHYNHHVLLLFSIALILLPFLKTIKIGKYLELERNIKETKEEVKDFKTEIRQNFQTLSSTLTATLSSINKQVVNHTTNVGMNAPTLPDNVLPGLESEIDKIVKAKLEQLGQQFNKHTTDYIHVPDDNLLMFKVRYNIETQLKRIWENRFITDIEYDRYRHKPIIKIIQDLTEKEIIDKSFYSILREILSICNYAIHGENVTENQVHFIKNSSPQVIDYLRQTK